MACFIVPAAAGLVAHSARKKIPPHWHIEWLSALIFGGAAGLAIEHLAHGEIVPWPPFLTAMATPAQTAMMLHEMAVVGIPMLLALIAFWALLVFAYNRFYASAKEPIACAAGI
ncbi:Uncharacterised protein [uncultured archaeon]|nr:Uncharacterised protein [uncultured archaeon]